MSGYIVLMARGRSFIEVLVQLIALCSATLSHWPVIKHASERIALGRTLPVLCRFRCQEMEQGVVGRGYCSPETCLLRAFWLSIGEMSRLFKQIVRKRHLGSFPKGFLSRACSERL